MLPALAVQRAIYRTLTEDTELQSLVSGVFDDVPEGTEFPYVVIGECTLIPDNYLTGFGREVRVTLHVWSRYRGFAEALAIADRVCQLLDHQPLEVDGWEHIATRLDFMETLHDPDPSLRHVPIQFSVIVAR